MFDIGFAELLIVAVLGLLVLGPDRLPTAIRTLMVWWKRLKMSVDSARRQVEQELNYSEMQRQMKTYEQQLRQAGQEIGNIEDIDTFNENQGKKVAADRVASAGKPARKAAKTSSTPG